MKSSFSQLSHGALLRKWDEALARDSGNLADVLEILGEVAERKLHLPAGYPSMFAYCVEAKHMSEDVAYKRIKVARAARRYPIILREIARGRLHLSGVALLCKHLNPTNAAELLAAAVHKSKAQIETLLAERFPQPDLPSRIVPQLVASAEQNHQTAPAPGRVEPVESSAPAAPVETVSNRVAPKPPSRVVPTAPERFGVQTTISKRVHDKLREAQELLSHQIAPNDLESLLECLLDLSLPQLRKRKHAATDQPRAQKSRSGNDPRYIPNAVKQAVWARDKGQCTFVSESGHRCQARDHIEYDHEIPVARGGTSTVANVRLRCRAHNQYEAEMIFGAQFMNAKRAASSA